MHGNNFFSEFLDILKNNFWPVSTSTPRSQSGFPEASTTILIRETDSQYEVMLLGYKAAYKS
jgi:hypothetical protein